MVASNMCVLTPKLQSFQVFTSPYSFPVIIYTIFTATTGLRCLISISNQSLASLCLFTTTPVLSQWFSFLHCFHRSSLFKNNNAQNLFNNFQLDEKWGLQRWGPPLPHSVHFRVALGLRVVVRRWWETCVSVTAQNQVFAGPRKLLSIKGGSSNGAKPARHAATWKNHRVQFGLAEVVPPMLCSSSPYCPPLHRHL